MQFASTANTHTVQTPSTEHQEVDIFMKAIPTTITTTFIIQVLTIFSGRHSLFRSNALFGATPISRCRKSRFSLGLKPISEIAGSSTSTCTFLYHNRRVVTTLPRAGTSMSTGVTASSLPPLSMKTSGGNLYSSRSKGIIHSKVMNHQEQNEGFSSYLETIILPEILSKEQKPKDKKTKLNIIMGNEAGDADSIISSLSLSYVKKKLSTKPFNKKDSDACIEERDDEIFLPLISIKKEDMSLRRDVVLLLQMAGIHNLNELLYLDDPRFIAFAGNTNEEDDDNSRLSDHGMIETSITLVDHNKIRSDLWHLEQHITEIIDHHQDEGFHTATTTATAREIAFENQKATVGSTCTLITERLMKLHAHKLQCEEERNFIIDAGLGLSLLGVILLDTMNMNPNAAKGTQRDETAINFLIHNTDWSALGSEAKNVILVDNGKGLLPDRVALFDFLQNSKFDATFWQEMNARDALRIDYKRFEAISGSEDGTKHSFGLSSVLLDANNMISKLEFYNTATDYIKESKIDFLGIMCMIIVDNKPQRELLLIGKNDNLGDLTNHLLTDASTAFLDISLIEDGGENIESFVDGFTMKRFHQGNPKGSRKQVAPVILSFFSG